MLNNITVGRYFPINSKIHQMNPVIKMICTLLFIFMNFFTNKLEEMIVLLLLVMFIIENSHLSKKIYISTFKSLRMIILFMLIIYLILGTKISLILIMVLRLYNIVLYTSVLTLTTSPNDLTYGLKSIFRPFSLVGLPVNKMAFTLSLAIRFIPTIIEQGNKILKSQASRGIDYYESNIAGKIVAIKSMILPMFILTIRRADILAETMYVRLYDLNGKRTSYNINKCHIFDILLLLLHILTFIIIVIELVIK